MPALRTVRRSTRVPKPVAHRPVVLTRGAWPTEMPYARDAITRRLQLAQDVVHEYWPISQEFMSPTVERRFLAYNKLLVCAQSFAGNKFVMLGVKALTSIRRGQNIAPYSGEIFHVDNPAVNEEAGYTYGMGLYSIEAKLRGNVTRFVNHSCDPNCKVETVWPLGPDHPPVLVFIARRAIKAGDYLSISYRGNVQPYGKSAEQVEKDLETRGGMRRTRCVCGTRKCLGLIWN